MTFLGSPRVRRRLAWLTLILVGAGVLVIVGVLLPNNGGSRSKPGAPSLTATEPGETSPLLDVYPDAATERARAKAVATVRPLVGRFLTAVIHQRDPALARSLLVPGLRSQNLPLSSLPESTFVPAATVAFSGPKLVGLVYQFSADTSGTNPILLAIRLKKANGRWLIDYLRQGHASRSIYETNFSPPGFSPGSQSTSFTAWLPLLLGFFALILLVVLVDRGLSRRRKRRLETG
jgi:hypothetical protein